MSAYENQLEHVVEPGSPSERREANSATIADYEALWFTECLREFAHYGHHSSEVGEIAIGYASYIDTKVRDEGKSHIEVYAHTRLASDTLLDALNHHVPKTSSRDDYPMVLFRSLETSFGELFTHFEEDEE